MIYRLLALNIDGTIVGNGGRISRETKEALDYVREKGVYVTLVSGRSFPSATKVARALDIEEHLVTHHGAYIGKEEEDPIQVSRLDKELTYDLVQFLESFTARIGLVHEEYSVMNKTNPNQTLLGRMTWSRESRFVYSKQYVNVLSDYLLENPEESPLMTVEFFSKQEASDAIEALRAMYNEVDCIKTGDLTYAIVRRGVSKLRGLLLVAEKLGISKEQIVMIGSGVDDIDAFNCCGLGVAMRNSSAEVKAAADWVTRSQEQNGVAYFVHEFFRKQQPIEFLKKMNIIKS